MAEVSAVAPDSNLLMYPTTRRYVTAMESMRDRRIYILPEVNNEMAKLFPIQTLGHVKKRGERINIWSNEMIDDCSKAAGVAAAKWWKDEDTRNDSVYYHIENKNERNKIIDYDDYIKQLPGTAFTDDNTKDIRIYAQALAHGIDVLVSRNFRSIERDIIAHHFINAGYSTPPVTIRNLYEHTSGIASDEGRDITEVAVEAVFSAIIPEDWTPERADEVMISARIFTKNLTATKEKTPSTLLDIENLSAALDKGLVKVAEQGIVQFQEKIHAIRPKIARETEARYHREVRSAVRSHGIELW